MRNPVEKTIQDSVLRAVFDVWGQTKEQHSIPITGRSMFPLIREGDQVLVAHGCTGMRRGDVIVFRLRGRLIAHRVLSIFESDAGPIFVTKGDNTPEFDPPLSSREIVGRVLTIKRGNRQMFLDTAIWRIMGWVIAINTLTRVKLQTGGRYLIQGLLGCLPMSLTTFLRRSEKYFFFLIRKIVFVAIGRWKT